MFELALSAVFLASCVVFSLDDALQPPLCKLLGDGRAQIDEKHHEGVGKVVQQGLLVREDLGRLLDPGEENSGHLRGLLLRTRRLALPDVRAPRSQGGYLGATIGRGGMGLQCGELRGGEMQLAISRRNWYGRWTCGGSACHCWRLREREPVDSQVVRTALYRVPHGSLQGSGRIKGINVRRLLERRRRAAVCVTEVLATRLLPGRGSRSSRNER